MMTFILTPQSYYNTITKPHACFLYSLLKDLYIDIPSNKILSILNTYHGTTSHDKVIFPLFIMHILMHARVSIPSSNPFHVIGTISKESLVWSFVQLVTKTNIRKMILLPLNRKRLSFKLLRTLLTLVVPLFHLLHILLPLLE